MARYTHARNSFLMGEVSPSVYARADVDQYHQMCEKLLNFLALPQGGVTRRTGSRVSYPSAAAIAAAGGDPASVGLWAESSINNKTTLRLIPIESELAGIYSGTQAGAVIMTTTNLKYWVLQDGILYLDVAIRIGGGVYGTDFIFSATTAPVTQFAQYGNASIIVDGTNPPMAVLRHPASGLLVYFILTTGYLANVTGSVDTAQQHRVIPYDSENTTSITMAVSNAAVGTGRTLTASSGTFTSSMVGRWVRHRDAGGTGTVGVCRITAYTDSLNVTVEVTKAFGSTTARTAWSFSQWGGDLGYPRTAAFFDSRLYLAGSIGYPDRFWASRLNNIYEFSNTDPTATTTLSDSFYGDIGQNETTYINTLFPKDKCFAVTQKKEAYLDSIDTTFSTGFGNTRAVNNSREGAAQRQGMGVGDSFVYIGSSRFQLNELQFALRQEKFDVKDLNSLAPDIVRDRALVDMGTDLAASIDQGLEGFVQIAYQRAPYFTLWARDHSGRLYSLTRKKDTQVQAWAHHEFGGSLSSASVKVLDMCVITVAGVDTLLLAVRRDVNGTARTCYEFIGDKFYARELYDSTYLSATPDVPARSLPVFMDYTLYSVKSAASVTHSVFKPLASQSVSVIADGIYVGELTVSSGGVITLSTAAKVVIAGFKYTSDLITTALDSNSLFGSGLGAIKRSDEVTLLFERTVNGKVGVDSTTLVDLDEFRLDSVAASDPTPLYTGEMTKKIFSNYDRKQNVMVRQSDPYPMTLNGIVIRGILYD